MLGCCGGDDDPDCPRPKMYLLAIVSAETRWDQQGAGGWDTWLAEVQAALAWVRATELIEGRNQTRTRRFGFPGFETGPTFASNGSLLGCTNGGGAVAESNGPLTSIRKIRIRSRDEFCISTTSDYGWTLTNPAGQIFNTYADGIVTLARMPPGVYDLIPEPNIHHLDPAGRSHDGTWGTFITRGCHGVSAGQLLDSFGNPRC